MSKKVGKIITIAVFLFVIYAVVSNKKIDFNNIESFNKKEVFLPSAFVYPEKSVEETEKSKQGLDIDIVDKVQEKTEKNEDVNIKQDKNTFIKEKEKEVIVGHNDSGSVCLVKKSECNTCVRKNKDLNFICTEAYCENETYICEKFAEETQ